MFDDVPAWVIWVIFGLAIFYGLFFVVYEGVIIRHFSAQYMTYRSQCKARHRDPLSFRQWVKALAEDDETI